MLKVELKETEAYNHNGGALYRKVCFVHGLSMWASDVLNFSAVVKQRILNVSKDVLENTVQSQADTRAMAEGAAAFAGVRCCTVAHCRP